MHINYKFKYLGIIFILISGYFFLYNFIDSLQGRTICLFKNATGIPCPACGSIRSTLRLMDGDFINSILINPFGIITNTFVVVSIFWMTRDVIKSKETFIPFLLKDWSKIFKIFVFFILLANWIWNIKKGI